MRALTPLVLSAIAFATAAAAVACSSKGGGGTTEATGNGGSGAGSTVGGTGARGGGTTTYTDAGTTPTPICQKGTGTAPVAAPTLLMNVAADTGWFSSPAIVDLSDGKTKTRALVVPSYSIDVYSAQGKKLSHVPYGGATADRI